MNLIIDLRPADILLTLSGLHKYLDVMEAQLEEVQRIERHLLNLKHPSDANAQEHEDHLQELHYLDARYEHDLRPAMRYSFVVLVHIVFETKLRDFGSRIQRDLKLPGIVVTDSRDSAIDQTKKLLERSAGIRAQDFPEWQQLQALQKVRNCIVHAYGCVAESRDEAFLRRLATQDNDFSIGDDGRITLGKRFCETQLAGLRALFNRLFLCVGWNP